MWKASSGTAQADPAGCPEPWHACRHACTPARLPVSGPWPCADFLYGFKAARQAARAAASARSPSLPLALPLTGKLRNTPERWGVSGTALNPKVLGTRQFAMRTLVMARIGLGSRLEVSQIARQVYGAIASCQSRRSVLPEAHPPSLVSLTLSRRPRHGGTSHAERQKNIRAENRGLIRH